MRLDHHLASSQAERAVSEEAAGDEKDKDARVVITDHVQRKEAGHQHQHVKGGPSKVHGGELEHLPLEILGCRFRYGQESAQLTDVKKIRLITSPRKITLMPARH